MEPISVEEAQEPIVTDLQVEKRVAQLVGRACRRQFWLLFVDEHDRQLDLLMPLADYPLSPGEGDARMLASRIREIMDAAGAAQVIFVWERRLGADSTPADRAWADELRTECLAASVAIRAQLISHRSGVRWFPIDEFLGSSTG